MRGADRWFRLLLGTFPADFRDRHGDDMRQAFDNAYTAHCARGRPQLWAFLIRTALDLGMSGLRERVSAGHGPASASPTVARRGGLVSWLDLKLGVRMLARHPGLTLVSTIALAVGIPVGLAPAHFVDGIMAPLPVPQGDGIRSLRLWSPADGLAVAPTQLDFEAWRSSLSSFVQIGASRETTFNVDADDGAEAVRSAAVSASTFDLLRVPPLLGRAIQPADEDPSGDEVAVIGYDLWQARFAGDPTVVGRTIRLGSVAHTVVGVMPEGFMFPKRQSLWIPLRLDAVARPEDALELSVFGRLAAGVTDAAARAEFASVARRSPAAGRDPRIEPQVEAYANNLLPGLNGGLRATPEFIVFQSLAILVLLVACANVGILVFARTAARGGELAVRTALGASRARIVIQVFTECLVLACLASGIGIALMALVFEGIWRVIPSEWAAGLPYWIHWEIRGRTIVQALGLAVASAAVAGVVPAFRFTGTSVQTTIQRSRARRSGVRFGGLPGALIVLDVAVAVAAVGFAATAYDIVRDVGRSPASAGIPSEEFLAASLRLPGRPGEGEVGHGEGAIRRGRTQDELVRRLSAEPGVRAVAVADLLPRMEHRIRRVEAEGIELPDDRRGVSVREARVALDFFDSLRQPILAGRAFNAGDLGDQRTAVIVNTTFVERVLGGQNAVGRRIRFRPWGDGEPGPWKEIVGVVGHLGMRMISDDTDQGVYEPFAPGELGVVRLGIQVGGDPLSFAPRLRAITAEVNPEAMVSIIGPLDDVYEGDWYLLFASSLGGVLLVGVLLALAASGIYAIMSFAVERRTTEIGIRTALGAGRGELVRTVATRAIVQLGTGVLLGMPIVWLFFTSGSDSRSSGALGALGVGVAVLVLVGVAACTGPTLRALRVDPREALTAGE